MCILRRIKWVTIVWILIHALPDGVYCQQSQLRFSNEVLASPIEYAQWFDANIKTDSVSVYEFAESSRSIVLDFGYAKATFQNELMFAIDAMAYRQPLMVEIVFTGYPINKDDWITNYYTLLANRATSLIEFDNRLNDIVVEWRLVIQTECATNKDAISMFHGAVISTKNAIPNKLVMLNPKGISFDFDPFLNVPYLIVPLVDKVSSNFAEIEPNKYPQRTMESYESKSKSRRKEPKCPSFTTRMQKPRRSIWSRIFR